MLRYSSHPLRRMAMYPLFVKPNPNSKRLKHFDLLNHIDGTLAFLNFNNPSQYNVLNTSTLQTLERTLKSVDADNDIRAAVLAGQQGFFSAGADYLYLAKACAEGKEADNAYLKTLSRTMYEASKIETPILPVLTGRAYGAAAVLAALSPYSLTTPYTRIKFPETGFGMIPVGGSSYFLSRLQLELGTYLALTGAEIEGSDAIYLSMAYKHIRFNDRFKLSLAESVNASNLDLHTLNMYENKLETLNKMKRDRDEAQRTQRINELANRTNLTDLNWIPNRENIKMVVADINYKDALQAEAKRTELYGKYRHFSEQTLMNSHDYFTELVASGIETIPKANFSLESVQNAIYRCFSCNSLQEIKERLQLEKEIGCKEWAEKTLDQLNSNSPLALELTLSLLRQAADLQWHQCLELEYNISANLSRHKDFTEGASKLLSRIKGQPEWSVKHPVSQDLVAEMNSQQKEGLELDAKDFELLPMKNYYEKYPDSVRYWMNEISPVNPTKRASYMFDVQIFMNKHDIDVRDHAVQIPEVRKAFYQQEDLARKVKEKQSKLDYLSVSEENKRFYVEHRRRAIEDFFASPAEFDKKLNSLIYKIFQDAFHKRVQTISDTSKKAHSYSFTSFLKDLKDFIARKRVQRDLKQIKSILEAASFDKKERDDMIEAIFDKEEDSEFNEMIEGMELEKEDTVYLDKLNRELSNELYIKTGIRNIPDAMAAIRKGSKFDLEAAKTRRLEILQEAHSEDYNLYTGDPTKRLYRKLLSEFYFNPTEKEVPSWVYEILEIKNIQDILEDIEQFKMEKRNPEIPSPIEQNEYTNYKLEVDSVIEDINDEFEDKKVLSSLVERLDLDEAYILQAFGKKSYLPQEFTELDELKKTMEENMDSFDLSEDPMHWVEKNFQSVVQDLFDKRFEVERTMSKLDLLNYDRGLLQKLSLSNIKNLVNARLAHESGVITWNKAYERDPRADSENEMIQDWKVDLGQEYFNKHMERVLLNDATSLYLYIKEQREKGKEKSPLPFNESYESEYQEMLIAEFNAGISQAPLKSEQEYQQLWAGKEYKTVDQKYKEYKDSKASLRSKELEYREQIKVTASLERLLQDEDIKKQLQNKNLLESVMNSLQRFRSITK